jgi:hypothetical protein
VSPTAKPYTDEACDIITVEAISGFNRKARAAAMALQSRVAASCSVVHQLDMLLYRI